MRWLWEMEIGRFLDGSKNKVRFVNGLRDRVIGMSQV